MVFSQHPHPRDEGSVTLMAREGSAGSWGRDNSRGSTMGMLPPVWKPTLVLSTLPKIKGRSGWVWPWCPHPLKHDPHPQILVPVGSQ